MKGAATIAGLVLSLAACDATAPARSEAPTEAAEGEVPFDFAGLNEAALVVPVFVNGEGPFDFVLDTGATLTCVDDGLASRLGLESRAGVRGRGVTIGGSGEMRIVTIDSVRVGKAVAEDLPACALGMPTVPGMEEEIQGLLGLNFLRGYRVTLDFERNVLTLTEP